MEKNNRQKGDEAEALAVEFFKKKGYVILKRNFHYGQIAEIDIVAKDKEYLVFWSSEKDRNYYSVESEKIVEIEPKVIVV